MWPVYDSKLYRIIAIGLISPNIHIEFFSLSVSLPFSLSLSLTTADDLSPSGSIHRVPYNHAIFRGPWVFHLVDPSCWLPRNRFPFKCPTTISFSKPFSPLRIMWSNDERMLLWQIEFIVMSNKVSLPLLLKSKFFTKVVIWN